MAGCLISKFKMRGNFCTMRKFKRDRKEQGKQILVDSETSSSILDQSVIHSFTQSIDQ